MALIDRVKERTGSDLSDTELQAMIDGHLPPAPIADLVGMIDFGGEEGAISVALVPERRHYNPLGTVHGGVISTLLDTAAGCSVRWRTER